MRAPKPYSPYSIILGLLLYLEYNKQEEAAAPESLTAAALVLAFEVKFAGVGVVFEGLAARRAYPLTVHV